MNLTLWAKAAFVGASVAALAGASLAATAPAPAATAAAPAKTAPTHHHHAVTSSLAPDVEPEAVDALRKMSAYLRTNDSFQVTLSTERDEVDDFGQVLTFPGQVTYKVRKPNGLSIEKVDGEDVRDIIYDGKSVTIYDPKTGFYAHFDAPPTIRQALDVAEEKYGIVLPMDDIFHWDQSDSMASELTSAHFVDNGQVNGQAAEHYAFRQPGVDWQIWIADGDKPVPLRAVIVASDDPARPQFEANLTWDTTAQFAADTFTFTPPSGAKPIPILAGNR